MLNNYSILIKNQMSWKLRKTPTSFEKYSYKITTLIPINCEKIYRNIFILFIV